MRVSILGAGQEVTGSCFLLECSGGRVIVDCGLFQGPARIERMNKLPDSLLDREIDAVLLTHGHLDHCGRLPLLIKAGYRGPIYATEPAIDIVQLILEDAARIADDDTARENEKRRRLRLPPLEPLFDSRNVARVMQQCRPVRYDYPFSCAEGITAEFVEAGHILGSASVLLNCNDGDRVHRVAFSGDLGPAVAPLMRDPATIAGMDAVFMESTYGDRNHRSLPETIAEFTELITAAVANKGKILIPSFAVGRTQVLLYYFAKLFREKTIPRIPIYLDSPMAIAATDLYNKHWQFMDDKAREWYANGQWKEDLQTLRTCVTVDDSKALNTLEGPFAIIAGAGMCNAGRILHHLRRELSNPETLVIICGYQAKDSLGRLLIDGAPKVKILGETVRVRATVCGLGGFSAHAGQSDLLAWLTPIAATKPRIILIHGEPHSTNELAYAITQRFGLTPELPKIGDTLTFTGSEALALP